MNKVKNTLVFAGVVISTLLLSGGVSWAQSSISGAQRPDRQELWTEARVQYKVYKRRACVLT